MIGKKSPKGPRVEFSYESAVIFTNLPGMKCPVCGADVEPDVEHECKRKKPA